MLAYQLRGISLFLVEIRPTRQGSKAKVTVRIAMSFIDIRRGRPENGKLARFVQTKGDEYVVCRECSED
jgi:hypothetical protein